jgi:hypothetical protein
VGKPPGVHLNYLVRRGPTPGPDKRYVRLKISPAGVKVPGGITIPDPAKHINPPASPLTLPNQMVIRPRDPEIRVKKIGACIYCGATEFRPNTGLPLHEEHIVPRGLDGTLILEAASCEKCQIQTGEKTENLILRTGMLAPRRQLKFQGRRRKRKETDYDLVSVVNNKDVKIRLRLEEHPSLLLIIGFDWPTILGGRGDVAHIFVQDFNPLDVVYKRGAEAATHAFDLVLFTQMLAKIGHGYAVAMIGSEKFKPYVLEFIRRDFARTEHYRKCTTYVGGDSVRYSAADPDILHQLGHEIRKVEGKRILSIGIRLFANLGAPVFWVAVGEMLSESSDNEIAPQKETRETVSIESAIPLRQFGPRWFSRWIQPFHGGVERARQLIQRLVARGD